MAVNRELYYRYINTFEKVMKVYNRMEVDGTGNIPETGGVLLCPRHENYSDPFFVAAAANKRVLHFLAWSGIAEMKIVGDLIKAVGNMHTIEESYGVATNREQAKQVLGNLRELLEAGEACVIFPEGKINHWIGPGGFHEFMPGAPRLAAQTAVPIIPVALWGTRWVVPNIINYHDFGGPDDGIWIPGYLPAKVKIRFGEPFHVDPAAASDRSVATAEASRLRSVIESMVADIRPRSLFDLL